MKFKNIMLIDDCDIDNYINKHLVTQKKIAESITVESSAIDALDYLSELKTDFPELIFLDVNMPRMNGFEFLDKFDGFPDEKKSLCRIVMLTSSQNANDIDKAHNNPYVIAYLNKPLNKEKLSAIMVNFGNNLNPILYPL